jgi:hypothetical protein
MYWVQGTSFRVPYSILYAFFTTDHGLLTKFLRLSLSPAPCALRLTPLFNPKSKIYNLQS